MTTSSFADRIGGTAAAGWEGLAAAFAENFTLRDELGANLCVIHQGETVVDLAGGWADPAFSRRYDADTLALVFSTTKGMTAIAAHWLVARGQLDLDAPVSRYWPEFAAGGKEAATVAMMLNHSVGVPGFREPLKRDAHLDWEYMVARIAAEEPFWEPGSRNGYHAMSFGWTVGELVRRVSGQSLGSFFRDHVAGPLGADFWIGLPEALEHRVATNVPTPPAPGDPVMDVYTHVMENPTSPSALTLMSAAAMGPAGIDEATGTFTMNTRAVHAAEIGAAGGIGSGRGIARIYAALGNGLIPHDHVVRMSQTSMVSMLDPIIRIPTRFALGFMKSMDNRARPLGHLESFVIGEKAFGHVGAGGSFGLYDREADVAIGYTMNRLHAGALVDARGQAIIDATYRALGYRTNAPGVWIR